jgi:hypothetical protein
MRGQPGFFDYDERLKRLSCLGDQLEAFDGAVDFEIFRADLTAALAYSDGAQGGRPPFDPVMMFMACPREGGDLGHSGGQQFVRRARRVPDE